MRLSFVFILILIGFQIVAIKTIAQEKSNVFTTAVNGKTLPIPKEPDQLFYLQRDPNSNTVIYTLNVEDGKINTEKPINIHWVRYAEGGKRAELSFIQRKMAYGVHHEKINETEFDIRIQAYKDLPIVLRYNKKVEKYQAFTTIKNKEVILERVFVRITGGSIFNPHVKYIEVAGYDPITEKRISHQFIP